MKKQIELTTEQAQGLIGKSPEMDELIKANFPELFETKLPKKWKELGEISGHYVDMYSSVINTNGIAVTNDTNGNVFATKSQAIAHGIAAAQLSQLMKVYNGDWVADWKDRKQMKYCIGRCADKFTRDVTSGDYNFIALKSKELLNEFSENFDDLIKAYYEL